MQLLLTDAAPAPVAPLPDAPHAPDPSPEPNAAKVLEAGLRFVLLWPFHAPTKTLEVAARDSFNSFHHKATHAQQRVRYGLFWQDVALNEPAIELET